MSQERTEKPTPKRREDARKKGQIARRPELAAAISFISALLTLRALGESLVARATHVFSGNILHIRENLSLTPLSIHQLFIEAITNVALLAFPVIAAGLVAGVAANFAQGGFILTPSALKPRGERFNPAQNIKKIFSANSAVDFLKSMLVIGGISMACYGNIKQALIELPTLIGSPAPIIFKATGSLAYQIGLRAGIILFLAAAIDYAYGWYKHEKSLKMTKQEIKDEYRQQEGDPMVKGQRRRAARALLQKHLSEVKTADVVITNPTHFAVALRYDREKEAAPVVVAKGADFMAQRIREIARESKVSIVENPPLARALFKSVDIGRLIPPEFFRAVAELLAYVYRQREAEAQ
ncbi:MAG TPA: flagellar biosynthesis protein FlhB [Blastocatellia bacterium]|nr:flagellar biosynthesis protein FlhB [Blastocatellia bacterium]